jgi:hypothetical protein
MQIVKGILHTSLAFNGIYRSITTAVLIAITVYSIYDGVRAFNRRKDH